MPHGNVCTPCKNRPCEICGKPFLHEWPYDQRACSPECRHKLRTDPTNIAKKEAKKRETLQAKYGVANVSQLESVKKKISERAKSEERKEKIRKTSLEKYGVDDFRRAPEVIENRKKAFIGKYGVDNPSKLDSVKKLISERLKDPKVQEHYMKTSMEHYGVPRPIMTEEVQEKAKQTCMERYGVPYYIMTPEYRSAQATKQISAINKAFADLLKEKYNVDTEFEFRLERKFFDLHVLNTNILVELNPTYTHSDLPNHWAEGLPYDYHLEKSQVAIDHGYRCIHVFDWDSLDKVGALMQPRDKIFARSCSIEEVDPKQIASFINEYHLQGNVRGAEYRCGLFYKGELVSAMTFGKPRYNKNYEWELLRLCTDSKYNVVGGPSRLLKKFILDKNPESIISYCDRAKFTGDVYTKIGMTLHHISPPAKIWSKDSEYVTDNLLRQRGYDQLFNTNYGKGTTNSVLMIENGWRSVFDCGQLVFEWRRDQKK